MSDRSLTIEQVMTLLAETAPSITALTAGLAPAHLHTLPGFDKWSVNDVLAHLRSCADVWGSCIEVILAQDRPTIRTVNPRTWINSTDYLEQEFHPSSYAFSRQRLKLLKVLKSLAHEDWSRMATVTRAGKPLVWTVHTYAQRLARHERPHLKQIERIVDMMRA